jgi:hypothetical protein
MTEENEELLRQQQLARQLEEETARTDLVWLMSDPRGRRIIRGLLARSGIYRTSFAGDSAIYFNEGRRSIGLNILSDIEKFTPQNYIVMLQEHMND